jgi:predicted branched-subunit amino acid permease
LSGATSRADIASGARAMAPLLLGAVPFGMVCGVVASDAGLPSAASLGMALLVCAGASQLVALRLVAEGGSVWLMVLSTLIVNLRFVMYSASLAPHFERLPARSKGLLAYLVNDASYAVAVPRFEEYDRYAEHGAGQDDDRYERANRKGRYFLGAGVSLLVVWMLSNAAGVFLGARVPDEWPLDFVIPLALLALLFPAITDRASVAAALSAGVVAVLGASLPLSLGLVGAALVGVLVGLCFGGRGRR